MKARYDMYDRSKSPHYLRNWLFVFWGVCLTVLLFYTVFVLLKDNKQLNKDVRYLSSRPRMCRSFVKEVHTGLVVVSDSNGNMCCSFFDTTNLIERK